MKRLLSLWRVRPRLAAAFLLACLVTLYFVGRFVTFSIYWAQHRDMPVEPWMTVSYAARSWGIDPAALNDLLHLPVPEVKGHPQPLAEIARDRGIPVADLVAEVEVAIAALTSTERAE
jgi:hypothetical protein